MNGSSPFKLVLGFLLCCLAGCASLDANSRPGSIGRDFDFSRDSFAYVNELEWEYRKDPASGVMTRSENLNKPEFVHRCFAVARMARQFFDHAEFAPDSPMASEVEYRAAIAQVFARTPARTRRLGRVRIPGFADLRAFSSAHASWLKAASGTPSYSYFQFSNWRMIFPFSRRDQLDTAEHMLARLRQHQLPIVHLIRFDPFPVTMIDHVVLVIGASELDGKIHFKVYDPNNNQAPVALSFARSSRTFEFPATNYFNDGPVDLYEIFDEELP